MASLIMSLPWAHLHLAIWKYYQNYSQSPCSKYHRILSLNGAPEAWSVCKNSEPAIQAGTHACYLAQVSIENAELLTDSQRKFKESKQRNKMTKGRDTSNLERLKAFRAKLAAQSKTALASAAKACSYQLSSFTASAWALDLPISAYSMPLLSYGGKLA